MQMLFDHSEENPGTPGLGVVPGAIRLLPEGVKRPQIQWNVLDVVRPSPLLDGLEHKTWVYFVHSYAPVPDDADTVIATCDYGGTVVAAVEARQCLRDAVPPGEVRRRGTPLARRTSSIWCGT